MGNDVSSSSGHRHHHRHHKEGLGHEELVALFKKSSEWEYIESHILNPLANTVSTEESKLAVLAMISRGRRGILDYVTLYGEMPPASVMKSLMTAHESILLETDYASAVFGSPIASLADFMSVVETETFNLDVQIRTKLSKVFGGDMLNPEFSSRLIAYPSVRQGLEEIRSFHERHLKGRVNTAEWTWADTAHVVFVVKSSIQWQQRLFRLFGHRLNQSIIVSIAEEHLKNAATQGPSCTAARLTILRALDARV